MLGSGSLEEEEEEHALLSSGLPLQRWAAMRVAMRTTKNHRRIRSAAGERVIYTARCVLLVWPALLYLQRRDDAGLLWASLCFLQCLESGGMYASRHYIDAELEAIEREIRHLSIVWNDGFILPGDDMAALARRRDECAAWRAGLIWA